MPYLRVTCPQRTPEQFHHLAEKLTDAINNLFFNPQARLTREDLRERTTVHFTPYGTGDFFIGGRTPDERGRVDVTIELSDWGMSYRQQKKVARLLTPVMAELFEVAPEHYDDLNIRFHPYPPKDFAVGGRLLSEMIPLVGRAMKRIFG